MKSIQFLGLGIELGQQRRGLLQSANAARPYLSRLRRLGFEIQDQGQIDQSEECALPLHAKGPLALLDWTPYKKAYLKIKTLLEQPGAVLNWGGDHSVALSTVGAFTSKFPNGYVVWIDAHADLNLPRTSPTGNLHGMPVSILLNLENIRSQHCPWIQSSLNAKKLIYVGLRDLDPFEVQMIQELGITAYTSKDVRQRGMFSIITEIFDMVKDHPLHVSFDIDSVDPEIAPSTGVLVSQGLQPLDLQILGQSLSHHKNLRSVDIVEVNPTIGDDSAVLQTLTVAFDFLTHLLTTPSTPRSERTYEKITDLRHPGARTFLHDLT
jgi:arginase